MNQPSPVPQQPRASLSQSIAFLMVYRRAAWAMLLGPSLSLVIPLGIFVGNLLTRGHAFLGCVLYLVIHEVLLRLTFQLSPTLKAYNKAIKTARSEVLSLCLSALVIWFVVIPFSSATNISLQWHPAPWPFCQFAATLVVVQIMLLSRYFGPQSIMRCSSVPLISNPFESFMMQMVNNPKSFLIPSETPGEYHFVSPRISSRRGSRFRHPPLVAMFAQMVAAFLSGMGVAHASGFDFVDAHYDFQRMVVLTGCVITTLLPLLFFVRGDLHELDPSRYTDNGIDQVIRQIFPLAASAFAKALVALLAAWGTAFGSTRTTPSADWATQVIVFFVYLMVLNLSVDVFDELFKVLLFFDSDFDENAEITLQCILPTASIVEKTVSKDSLDHRHNDLRLNELKRVEALILEASSSLMSKAEQYIEAPLEEDILRLSVLHTLGGGTGAAKRQFYAIRKHIDADSTGGRKNHQAQPDILLLLRGLCVFAGGVSDAIRQTTEKRKFQKISEHWFIPPGAISSLIYAIRAIERCLRQVQEHSSNSIKTQVSVVLPAVVTTLFHARTTSAATSKILVANSRSQPGGVRLDDVIIECDRAAVSILSSNECSTPEAIYQMKLDKLVSEWLHTSVDHGNNSVGLTMRPGALSTSINKVRPQIRLY